MAEKNIVLSQMGSMLFGGTVVVRENHETFHGDHGYAQYFIPEDAYDYPIIFWHGMGQSGRCFESTPDGRDGFWQIFTRAGWATYVIDQPRRGRAGYTQALIDSSAVKAPIQERESAVWKTFRIGDWMPPVAAAAFPGVQFPLSPEAIEQFLRQQTPDTGAEPATEEYRAYLAETMADLLRQSGPSILFTHSHSGQYGWKTAAVVPELVKAVITYKPGNFVFPEDEEIPQIPSPIQDMVDALLKPQTVTEEEFMNLTQIPILIYYGDNISMTPSSDFNVELWRISVKRGEQFVDTINRHGGNAKLIKLPDIGIYGNTHNAMGDLNNQEFAAHIQSELHLLHLDAKELAYQGPEKKKLNAYTIPFNR